MDKKEFMKLVDKNKYQVFLFVSHVPFPMNFALHGWFVINLKGDVNRWEFGSFYDSPHSNGVGVLKNFFEPCIGMNKFFWKKHPRFKGKLVDYIEGKENSVAKNMALFIEKNSEKYPLKDIYKLTGPNSNTYIGWILNKFPESNLRLPLNAFGRSYKVED